MMLTFLLFSLFCGAMTSQASPGQARPRAAPVRTDILQKYSFEALQDAATYMAIRTELPNANVLKCDPPLKKIKLWLSHSLHGLIDEKKDKQVKAYSSNPALYAGQLKTCASTCRCSAYYGILEEADEHLADSKIHQDNFKTLKNEIKKQNRNTELKCSKKMTWLCQSLLLKFLKTESQ